MAPRGSELVRKALTTNSARRREYATLAFVAVMIMVSVALGLHQRGIAATHTEMVLDCHYAGSGAHTHDESCYDADGNLVCPLQEREYHVHDDSCYTETRELVCGLEESEGHEHSDACYDEEGNLTCGLEESEGHQHTDACYAVTRELTCGKDEVTEAHVHGPGCFREVTVEDDELVAQGADEVTDTVAGEPTDPAAGSEPEVADGSDAAAAKPEQSFAHEFKDQDGNLVLRVDAKAPEGVLPEGSVMRAEWVDPATLTKKQRKAVGKALSAKAEGAVLAQQAVDITFLDAEGNKVEPSDKVMVTLTSQILGTDDQATVVHIDDLTEKQLEAQEEALKEGKTVEEAEPKRSAETIDSLTSEELHRRDTSVSGDQIAFDADKFSTYVLSVTSIHRELRCVGEDVTVTVDAPAQAGVPAGATLQVTEIGAGTDEHEAYQEAAMESMGAGEEREVKLARFFDIKIMDASGREVQPADAVQVSIELADAPRDAESADVVHFDSTTGDPEVVDATEDEGTSTFEAESFSVYGVVYTVDFHYEVNGKMYEFSIPGGGFVTLQQLVEVLGIANDDAYSENMSDDAGNSGDFSEEADGFGAGKEQSVNSDAAYMDVEISEKTREFIADVAGVKFSNSDLVWVGKTEESTTVGGLKDAGGLKCHYSVDLTEEQIEEINAQTVESGDWALISLQPFETEECLTITMGTGEVFTLKVTDAQISTHVLTADGKDFVITVTYGPEAEIPNGSKLHAAEILEGSEKYKVYYEKTLQVLQEQTAEENYLAGLDFARFFDVTIYDSEGVKIEPKAPVEVKISYEDPVEVADYAELKVVHFADQGTEIIDIDNEEQSVSEIVYEQNGFSVIGTVGATDAYGWPQGNDNPYVVILQSGDKYYAVAHDGTLKEVHYLNETVSFMGQGTTTLDYLDDYLWDYTVVSSTRHTATLSTSGEDTPAYIDPVYGVLPGNPDTLISPAQRTLYINNGQIYATYYGTRYTLSAEGGELNRTTVDASDASPILFAPRSSFMANSSESEDYDYIDIETLIEEWKRQMTQDLVVDKTAEVVDYENRIYEVDLAASSGYHLVTPALAMEFVLDASRSMFFPENLYEHASYSNLQGFRNWINNNGDRSQVYYVITDPNGQATNWAVYWNTSYNGWYVVDASNHDAPDGNNQTGQAINNWNRNNGDGTIYIADEKVPGQPWCRLDYMKLAVSAAARVLFAVDPSAQIGIVTFNNDDFAYGPFTQTGTESYSAGNVQALINALNNISLSGGTQHDKGLNRAVTEFTTKFHEITNCQTTVVLITDGAPVNTTWDRIRAAAANARSLTNAYGQPTRLFTLGLSLERVGNNKQYLADIATDPSHAFNAEKSSEVVSFLTKIIEGLVVDANLKGNVTDVIDAAFYPVNPNTGMPLESGTWITLEGRVTTQGAEDAAGKVIKEGNTWKVEWNNQLITWPDSNTGKHGWNGRIYLKAQEDFLGGNDINTNASGSQAEAIEYINPRTQEHVVISSDDAEKIKEFDTPYVDVDELAINENSTEWTVYLGESVDPRTELEELLDLVQIYEVVKEDGSLVYTYTPGSTDNPTSKATTGVAIDLDEFLGTLSDQQWDALINGDPIETEYTAYGHTPGSIWVTLTQEVVNGEDDLTPSPHNTAVVGEEVEKYTLTVTYEPYDASVADYHTGNNITGSHGADTDEMVSENVHIINVFAKGMQITKTDEGFAKELTGAKFVLYRTARNGDDQSKVTPIEGATGNYYPVAELDLSSSASGTINPVEKLAEDEKYYLVETEAPTGYYPLDHPIPVTLEITNSYVPKPGDQSQQTKPTSGIYDWTQTAVLNITDSAVKKTDANNTVDLTNTAIDPDSENIILYFRIANSTGYELPSTGGPGARLFTILGSILILGAGVLLWRRRKLI